MCPTTAALLGPAGLLIRKKPFRGSIHYLLMAAEAAIHEKIIEPHIFSPWIPAFAGMRIETDIIAS
jgi:hypothetical protein